MRKLVLLPWLLVVALSNAAPGQWSSGPVPTVRLGNRQGESEAALKAAGIATSNIMDLIAHDRIEVTVRGQGNKFVSLALRRKVADEFAVLVPAGTRFVPDGSSRPAGVMVSEMVATEDRRFALLTDVAIAAGVPAVATSFEGRFPQYNDALRIVAPLEDSSLTRVTRLLQSHPSKPEVWQAAVWIAAADADYDELGALVTKPILSVLAVGERAISKAHVAEAMFILDEAGIDLSTRAIWSDRDRVFDAAPDSDTKSMLQRTRARRPAGRDVVDLIDEKKITVDATGLRIQCVQLTVRRLSDEPVAVRIPVGTYFTGKVGVQDMVSTNERTVYLDNAEPMTLRLRVVCANRTRKIPGREDALRLRRSSESVTLQKGVTALQTAGADFPVRQAAVWIVTDDANFADLGSLSSGPWPLGTRVIDEYAVAQAMKILDNAGIGVTERAIWRDAPKVFGRMEGDKVLLEWFAGKGGKAEPPDRPSSDAGPKPDAAASPGLN